MSNQPLNERWRKVAADIDAGKAKTGTPMTYGHLRTLYLLIARPRIMAKDVAAAFGLPYSTAMTRLTHLEQLGYLKRTRLTGLQHRRKDGWLVTGSGVALIGATLPEIHTAFAVAPLHAVDKRDLGRRLDITSRATVLLMARLARRDPMTKSEITGLANVSEPQFYGIFDTIASNYELQRNDQGLFELSPPMRAGMQAFMRSEYQLLEAAFCAYEGHTVSNTTEAAHAGTPAFASLT